MVPPGVKPRASGLSCQRSASSDLHTISSVCDYACDLSYIIVDVVLYVVMPHVVDVVMPHQIKHACGTAHIRNDELASSVL